MDDWVDEGLGHYQNSSKDNEVYFKVVTWPSANAVRIHLGLEPADFHITVGFKIKDIHDIDKSKNSLLKKS